MCYIVPLTLFGATTALAAESLQDYFDQFFPECLQQCVSKLKSATGCSSGALSSTDPEDMECLCNSITTGAAFNDAANFLAECALDADCSMSDLSSLQELDVDKLRKEAESLCPEVDKRSSSVSSDSNCKGYSNSNEKANNDS